MVKLDGDFTQVSADSCLAGKKIVCFYFSAHWCPPCRAFTPMLKDAYEEFLEDCLEGALSIEVYGHRSAGFATTTKWDERRQLAKSLADRLDCFISHSTKNSIIIFHLSNSIDFFVLESL